MLSTRMQQHFALRETHQRNREGRRGAAAMCGRPSPSLKLPITIERNEMIVQIREFDVMDTVVWVDIGLTLKTGTILFMEVIMDIDRHDDEIIFRPSRFGSVIFRDPKMPLDLAFCYGDDRSDNPYEVIRSLANHVDIALDPYPEEDDCAIWHIESAVQAHFHVKGQTIPNRQWFLEAIEELIQDAFPEELFG